MPRKWGEKLVGIFATSGPHPKKISFADSFMHPWKLSTLELSISFKTNGKHREEGTPGILVMGKLCVSLKTNERKEMGGQSQKEQIVPQGFQPVLSSKK